MSESLRGRFVWYDLMTTDPAAAQAFYTQLIGWGTQDWEGGGTKYTMWTNGGAPLGGTMQLPPEAVAGGAHPHWLGYVATPDVDATAARAGELGAKVMMPPTDIPTVGRFAVLADPQGALFAAYTPLNEPPESAGMAQVGEVSWHELITSDHAAAFDFYSELFGWVKTDAMDMGEMGIYQMYGRPQGPPLGGMMNQPPGMPGPPAWQFYIRVADIHKAVEQARELGAQLLYGPQEVPGGGLIANFLDPQGGAFALYWAAQ